MPHPFDTGLRGGTCPHCRETVTVLREMALDIQRNGCGCVECTCDNRGWERVTDPKCPIHGDRQQEDRQ